MGNARRDRDHWIPHLFFFWFLCFFFFCGVGGKVLGFNRFPTNGPSGHNLNDDRPCFNERNYCFDVVVFNPRARDSLSHSVSYISDFILGFWTFLSCNPIVWACLWPSMEVHFKSTIKPCFPVKVSVYHENPCKSVPSSLPEFLDFWEDHFSGKLPVWTFVWPCEPLLMIWFRALWGAGIARADWQWQDPHDGRAAASGDFGWFGL